MNHRKFFLGMIVLLCVGTFAAADSYQMFFKLEGVQGETAFQGEEGWNNLLAWSWGASQSGTMHTSIISVTPTSYTGPKMESVGSLDGFGIKFSKWVDKSSAALNSFFEKKIKIPSAKLCLLMVVGEKETTWTYEMRDVIITSHEQEGKRENLTFNYGKITWSSK